MNRKRTMIFVLTACFLAAAAFPASAQEYEIIELGTLGGTSTRARVITEDGVVYGWSTLASGEKHAVRWDASGIVDLGAPPGFLSASPAAANDAGQAAINGEGVALGRGLLVADPIEAGKLVAPFDLALTAEYRYYVACTERNYDRPKVRVFRDWLMREAKKTASRLPRHQRLEERIT